jgi:hypothetical protein
MALWRMAMTDVIVGAVIMLLGVLVGHNINVPVKKKEDKTDAQ